MSEIAPETPVSVIEGDRLCAGCAYNLRGQTVVREHHYGLFIARCPECGTPAALQEYPLLGRWPGRVRVFVSLAYALVCLFAIFVTFMILMGMTAAFSESADDELANTIAQRWALHVNQEEAEGNMPLKNMPLFNQAVRDQEGRLQAYVWNYVDKEWWKGVRSDVGLRARVKSVLEGMGGMVLPLAFMFFVGGSVWAVLLLSVRRLVIFVVILIPASVVVLFLLSNVLENNGFNGWNTASGIAQDEMFGATAAVVLSLWLVCAGVGIAVGRPLARLGVRALLPPTMRGSLAELWFTDGKALPTGTRAPRKLHPEARNSDPV